MYKYAKFYQHNKVRFNSNYSCYVCLYLDKVDMHMYVKMIKVYHVVQDFFLLLLSHMDEGTHTTPKDGQSHNVYNAHQRVVQLIMRSLCIILHTSD